MIAISGLCEAGKFAGFRPVEVPAVDDDAAHAGAVAADPFGAAVRDDVGAEGDGFGEIAAHAEGVVDDKRDSCRVGNVCDSLDVWDVELRVSNSLAVG